MKFKIVWIEVTEETGKKLKDFMESLPNPKITGIYNFKEGIKEIECSDTFEATDIDEAKRKVIKEDYYEVEIFTVFNADTGEKLFTEEDFK